jgi:hypothetical protein
MKETNDADTGKKIFQAISNILNDVEAISKSKKNTQQGFMYRGIDDMYNDLHPLFAKHRVFVVPEVLESLREERTSQKGGMLLWTVLKVRFRFYAEDGSSVIAVAQGEAMDSGDKGSNKAMSVALKYTLIQLLLIPTEEEAKNETDKTTHQVAARLPLLSPAALEKARARIVAGELDLADKITTGYSLTKEQRDVLIEAVREADLSKAQITD